MILKRATKGKPGAIFRIAALITSHNRRELTLNCLRSLFSQTGVDQLELTAFLVDDGSSDGTLEAVAASFAQVRLLRGDGSLFWNGGMRKAFQAAMQEDFDAFLWFNDDSHLYGDALARLVACSQELESRGVHAIVTGSMRSSLTGKRTYGGQQKRAKGFHLHFDAVMPDPDKPLECDTMNGNFVLIPKVVAAAVGNLEPTFRHQIGDLDYGLRAKQAGFSVVIAPGFHGECDDNSRDGTWRDNKLPFGKRWTHLMSPKGAPWKEWLLYTRRHFGWRWPFYAVSPYIKTIVGAANFGGGWYRGRVPQR